MEKTIEQLEAELVDIKSKFEFQQWVFREIAFNLKDIDKEFWKEQCQKDKEWELTEAWLKKYEAYCSINEAYNLAKGYSK